MKILDRYNLCLRTAALAALLLGSGCTKDEVDLVVGEKGTSQSVYLSSKAGTETVRIESGCRSENRFRDWRPGISESSCDADD